MPYLLTYLLSYFVKLRLSGVATAGSDGSMNQGPELLVAPSGDTKRESTKLSNSWPLTSQRSMVPVGGGSGPRNPPCPQPLEIRASVLRRS